MIATLTSKKNKKCLNAYRGLSAALLNPRAVTTSLRFHGAEKPNEKITGRTCTSFARLDRLSKIRCAVGALGNVYARLHGEAFFDLPGQSLGDLLNDEIPLAAVNIPEGDKLGRSYAAKLIAQKGLKAG